VEVDLTATTVNGAYILFNIPAGKYRLKFELETGQSFTLKDIDEVNGSDVDSLGFTELFDIKPNTDYNDFDAGIIKSKASIIGKLTLDYNKNKKSDDEDRPINSLVLLFNDKNEKIAETRTSPLGNYNFTGLEAGKYYVQFDSIPNLAFYETKEVGTESDITNENGRGTTKIYDLSINNNIIANGFYFNTKGRIQGTVFFNDSGDNSFNTTTNKTISNTNVYLLNQNGFVIDSTKSREDGSYVFDDVDFGNYFIEGRDINVDSILILNQHSDTLKIGFCSVISDVNIGYTGIGKITGRAFIDQDEDGLDNQTAALDGIILELRDVNGNLVKKDTTASIDPKYGFYLFENVKAGRYVVRIQKPLFYVFSTPNVANNTKDTVDSDFTPIRALLGVSDTFLLLSGGAVSNLDAGFIPRAPNNSVINGLAWSDENGNGLRETTERTRANIEMVLCSDRGVQISKITTGSNGTYSFSNIVEGFYSVKSILTTDETATLYQQGDTLLDNDFSNLRVLNSTPIFYLGISENKKSIDLGIAKSSLVGDFVWDDLNINGIQDPNEPGLPNVEVAILTIKGDTVVIGKTDASGKYRLSNMPTGNFVLYFRAPFGYTSTLKDATTDNADSDIDEVGRTMPILLDANFNNLIDAGFIKNGGVGDRIWIDYNANGIQEDNEPGIDSVKVSLYNSMNNLVKTTFTKSKSIGQAGFYLFEDIKPGDYYITLDLPKGMKFSPINLGQNNNDSDINPDGKSDVFKIFSGITIDSIDGGVFTPGCIGDRIWVDANKNGIQDNNEVGLPNVIVRLLRSNGSLIETQTTNAKGEYLFNTLAQGLYQLEVRIPEEYTLTKPDEGDDDTKDSDFQSNGRTPLISLAHAAKVYDLDGGLTLKAQVNNENKELNTDLYNPIPVPNPALSDIKFDVPFDKCDLSIFAGNGNLVLRILGYQKFDMVDVSGLKAGIYYVIAQSGTQKTSSRFIKVD
jgi:serine-aspartate repeat-containing protein C/D/E